MSRVGESLFTPGPIVMWIAAVRGKQATLDNLFSRMTKWPACLAMLLVADAASIPARLELLPIEFLIGPFLILPMFYVVDADLGVFAAYREGLGVARRSWRGLLMLGLATPLMFAGGALACGVGTIAVAAIWDLVIAAIYCMETGTESAVGSQ